MSIPVTDDSYDEIRQQNILLKSNWQQEKRKTKL